MKSARRVRWFDINAEIIAGILVRGGVSHFRVVDHGLPPDAVILNVAPHPQAHNVIRLLIESQEFRPVPEGGAVEVAPPVVLTDIL